MPSKRPDGNIAFKVTYNDKKWSDICSPKIYEINVKKKIYWCCNQTPYHCQKDFSDEDLSGENAPCYDSVALKLLRFSPGWQHRKTKKPYHCKQVRIGKIAILTSLKPGADQSERFIFAVFAIKRKEVSEDGTEYYYGYVRSAIILKRNQYLNFWDYYRNPNSPKKKFWGSMLFRYPTDVGVRRLLKDIIKSSKFTKVQKKHAKVFLKSVS